MTAVEVEPASERGGPRQYRRAEAEVAIQVEKSKAGIREGRPFSIQDDASIAGYTSREK